MAVPRPYAQQDQRAVADWLRPYSIRDEHDPPPRPRRHRGRSWRHIAAGFLALAVVLIGVVVIGTTAAAQSSGSTWPRQAELRQDARQQLDRTADRGES